MPDFNKHVIITGSARSGTSWLTEIIATQFRYRLLFEPEHEFNTREGHLICDRYFEEQLPENALKYLTRVFKNRVDNDWIAQCSNRRYKMHLWPLIPKKFIVKFVRANLSAVSIHERFQIPVVHIIRNPYEVLHSQKRVSFPWLFNLDHFKSQAHLVELLKDHFNFDVTAAANHSPLEILAIRWCIENVVPLKIQQPNSETYRVLKYEDLVEDIQVFFDFCKAFDIEPVHNIEAVYKKPSSKTHPKSKIRTSKEVELMFTVDERLAIEAILKVFKANFYL